MIKLLVLLLGFSGVTHLCDPPGPLKGGSTCEPFNETNQRFYVIEGEGLYIKPDALSFEEEQLEQEYKHLFTWHRKQGCTSFSSSEKERIHHHGPTLFFLPCSITDSDFYIARLDMENGTCFIFSVSVEVVTASDRRLYITAMETNGSNPKITCPDKVDNLCKKEKGDLSWDRNATLMAGEANRLLRLQGATKADEAVYTCRCTWRHNKIKDYNFTGSMELKVIDKEAYQKIQIIHPTTKELKVHPGFELSIKCKAFFGINIQTECEVTWEMNNHSVDGIVGYRQIFSRDMERLSKNSFYSSTLIIDNVQESDLKASFRCRAKNQVDTKYHTLTLKRAESLTSLVVAMMCVSAVFLIATTAIKCFAVDLVLFSRRFLPCTKARNDGSQYDVYVVCHSQKENKAMEEVLSQFLYRALPQVLEKKCGFRVFIHDRDAIPGEDRLKQVEERVKLSRRLMVVLTPEVDETLGSSPSGPPGVAVDWQIGLHHALIQQVRVILVQLGDMGPQGYSHLSPTLQHLVRKCAPLCWREDSPGAAYWYSHFWKRVRYAMPATVAKPSSSVV